jgi:hypothetical protein
MGMTFTMLALTGWVAVSLPAALAVGAALGRTDALERHRASEAIILPDETPRQAAG